LEAEEAALVAVAVLQVAGAEVDFVMEVEVGSEEDLVLEEVALVVVLELAEVAAEVAEAFQFE